MKLDKAIDLLKIDNKDPGEIDIKDFIEAEKLAIESLEAIQQFRLASLSGYIPPLPSETT